MARRILAVANFLSDIGEWDWPQAPARRLLYSSDNPRLPQPLPRFLPPDADRRLSVELETSPNRLAADALLLQRACGLRIGELLDLELDAVIDIPGSGSWLKVSLGKLDTERMVPIDTEILALVDRITTTRSGGRPLPHPRTRDYVRGLLVEHGALPRRDELLARFTAWSDQALDRLPDGEHRDVVRRFIRWHLIRRMNGSPGAVTQGTFLRSKQTTTVTIDFLTWLTARGTTLSQLTQADLDAWQAGGPTTREVASRFLAWATKAHLVDPNLRMQPHRRGTADKLPSAEQTAAVQAVIHHDDLTPRDQLAAILVLVLGQQIEDDVRLTWDNTTVTDDLATITLGATPITVPPPLDQPLRQLHAEPGHGRTAAHPNTPWIFRGHSPGRHLSAAHLRQRLKTVCSTRAARLGTLADLATTSPIPVLAEILGYHQTTLERHAVAAATTYGRYIATRR